MCASARTGWRPVRLGATWEWRGGVHADGTTVIWNDPDWRTSWVSEDCGKPRRLGAGQVSAVSGDRAYGFGRSVRFQWIDIGTGRATRTPGVSMHSSNVAATGDTVYTIRDEKLTIHRGGTVREIAGIFFQPIERAHLPHRRQPGGRLRGAWQGRPAVERRRRRRPLHGGAGSTSRPRCTRPATCWPGGRVTTTPWRRCARPGRTRCPRGRPSRGGRACPAGRAPAAPWSRPRRPADPLAASTRGHRDLPGDRVAAAARLDVEVEAGFSPPWSPGPAGTTAWGPTPSGSSQVGAVVPVLLRGRRRWSSHASQQSRTRRAVPARRSREPAPRTPPGRAGSRSRSSAPIWWPWRARYPGWPSSPEPSGHAAMQTLLPERSARIHAPAPPTGRRCGRPRRAPRRASPRPPRARPTRRCASRGAAPCPGRVLDPDRRAMPERVDGVVGGLRRRSRGPPARSRHRESAS